MTIPANDIAKDILAYTMVNDKQSLKNLLSRNGIVLPNQSTDRDVVVATLMASSRSPFFKSELTDLLSQKAEDLTKEYQMFAGGQFDIGTGADKMFTAENGFYNQIGGYISPTFAQGVTAAASTAKQAQAPPPALTKKEQRQLTRQEKKEAGKGLLPWLKENIFTKENINTSIGIGLNAINNKVAQRGNQIYYESDDVLRREAELARYGYGTQKPQTNVTTIALVVLGVVVLGGILYISLKKK